MPYFAPIPSALNRKSISSDLTILESDAYSVIQVDTSTPVEITLPTPNRVEVGRTYWIIDAKGLAADNNITLSPNASDKIDGANTSKLLKTSFGSWWVSSDGTNWVVKSWHQWSRLFSIEDPDGL